MLLPRRKVLASLLVTALLTAGCGEMATHLGELTIVQSELLKKFGEDVMVNTSAAMNNNMVLTVWFVNSSLNEQSVDARLRRAAQAAQVVKTSYPRIQKISEVWVGFLRKKTRFVVFHRSEVVSVHGFDKNGQPLARRNEIEQPPGNGVTVSYLNSSDETDISVNGIQLEGEPGGLGITLLPFFKVPGNARAYKGSPPQTVALHFASYAEKPRFPQTVPIVFITDGKVVLKTEGIFKGQDAQFCYLHITYKAFHRMVSGKELKIKLGAKEYPLTPSQLAAMHAMTEYVTE